jgi:glycosyltransferase involved in cell wall biosynthesis
MSRKLIFGIVSLFIVACGLCYLLFRPSPLPQQPHKICLNMIVKDESAVIERCLDSVKHLIDTWVIVDTGSSDNTPKIINNHLKGIPGKLYFRPWKNFEHNRNEALQLAKSKADYILFMDADDVLEWSEKAELPPLTKDLYNMWRGTQAFTYHKPQLVKSDKPWKWVGVTHEYLDCDEVYTSEVLSDVRYVTKDDGASSVDPQKFYKNIHLLTEGLKKEPHNTRYVFYLAESYRAAGEKAKALEWYQKAVDMNGWDQEVFWSLLQIGHHLRDLGLPSQLVTKSYKRALEFRPHRIEPTYYLAAVYNKEGEYGKAYSCLKAREFIEQPTEKDALFNEDWIAEYGLLFQLSICSYYLGHYQESLDACDALLAMPEIPTWIREQTEVNREFPLSKLKAKVQSPSKV